MSCITLHNVLYVPNMWKNLISVSQLIKDHDLVAEFDSHTCVIKDKNTGQVLLRGQLKDGLHQLNSVVASVDFRLLAHSLVLGLLYAIHLLQHVIVFLFKM